MKFTIYLIVSCLVIVLSGCAYSQQQLQQFENRCKYEIVWHSDKGNPYQDGKRIYIDLDYINKHQMSLSHIIRHESGHIEGKGHCTDKSCLMYPVCPRFGERNYCPKCDNTTINWLENVIKGK